MPTALREQVVAQVKTILDTITGISGLTVERLRARPVPTGKAPRLVIGEGSQRVQDGGEADGGVKIIEAVIPIEGYVTAATDVALGTALNDLYARTVEALELWKATGSPQHTGPLDLDFTLWAGEGDLETDFDTDEGHAPMGAFTLTWIVRYQVSDFDPYAAP